MERNISNIYCPTCGAPAYFDIVHQTYLCRYCGGNVSIEQALATNSAITKWSDNSVTQGYNLDLSTCTGCGARIVFGQSEALSNCEFCGRTLVRNAYTSNSDIPRYVIPFGITPDEAKARLAAWCNENSDKHEAKLLAKKLPQLQGYYLPYEMVQGPVHCKVNKAGETTKFEAHGYLNGEFVNRSKQLDNQVLDAMEPFDLSNLQEFNFAYVAGHRVKISDIDDNETSKRLAREANENYKQPFEKMWGTKAIFVESKVDEVVKFPVLLPVYYIKVGGCDAAVNGQTGKVSVSAEKRSSFLFIPWWIKGLVVLLLALGATFAATYLGGMALMESLYITGVLGLFFLIVFLCMFEDGGSKKFKRLYYHEVYNSGEQTYRREQGKLVLNEKELQRRIVPPVFMRMIDGKMTPVSYKFRSLERIIKMILLSLLVVSFPVLIALPFYGFDFTAINYANFAVWFCIAVPIVPIFLVRFGIEWLYERPWVYTFTPEGKLKRYRKKLSKTK